MAYTDARNKNDSYKYTKGVSKESGFETGGKLTCPGIRGVYRRFSDLMDKGIRIGYQVNSSEKK